MKYLLPGQENPTRIELLLSLTRITSEVIISAVIDHLCKGMSETDAAIINGTTQSNLNRAVTQLNAVAATVEAIKELDWPSYQRRIA
ncbi:hypothetical protein [Ferrimonas aestuarii]|uniref:Adhesin biosynthesis transcription regulatory protein n=1 Tax=Ferrimonas aestuarii TaxID=2569539 RepID=A0A4U1BN37_9GAMM|nr:hypothetical protein [Ferrimonas aestuarii]TKB53279.1 hypothetical protein FCL42_14500 [Ferrimonas aestuarii]